MKKISTLILMTLAFVAVSCVGDDDNVIIPGPPTGTDVRYMASAGTTMFESIRFVGSDGEFNQGFPNAENPTQWSRTIIVPFPAQPFVALAEIKFKNQATTPQNFTLKIFEDNVLVKTEEGTIPGTDAGTTPPSITRTIQVGIGE